jgi:hypothetical protein
MATAGCRNHYIWGTYRNTTGKYYQLNIEEKKGMKKKILIAAVCVIAVAAVGSDSNGSSENRVQNSPPKVASDVKVQDIPEKHTLDDYSLDELQKLYLAINPSMSYLDALQAVQDSGLPYSNEKYNGSRMIQVAFTEGCTAQKYMKESGDFLEISFNYPRNENSLNDVLSKYFFSFCKYCPASGATLTSYGSDVGNCIEDYKNDTSDLPDNMTKEDQLLYYFEHRD